MSESLDFSRLENIKPLGNGATRAACPACRAEGSDKGGDHLLIQPDGKFGCAANPKDGEHRKAIFKLAGRQLTPQPKPQLVESYPYLTAGGTLAYEVCRFIPKTFRQRRPDGNGGWIWNMDGVSRVPFRLPELITAVADGRPIYVAEGEKDVLALAAAGFAATCNAGGAGKWLSDYNEPLRGADVFVIADKDEPGRKHARAIAANLHGVAASVRVLELPEANGKPVKDAHDFFAAGGLPAELDEFAQAAPVWTPPDAAPAMDLPDLIDAAAFLAETIDPPAELIAGILHRGSKLAFGGSSKSFKTWCLLDLAISVATGAEWLGHETAQGKVLFVNFEIQPHPWQRRITAVATAKGVKIQTGQIILWNLRGHAADFRQLIPRIVERCRAEDFALVVLDPIYKLYGGTDENAAGDVAELLNSLERLATETGAAIAFGAHFAKGNASAKAAIDRISGSGVFARDPDSLLIFTQHEAADSFTVEPILRNFAPVAPFAVRWEFPLMRVADDLDPTKLKQVAGRKKEHDPLKLLALIANNDEQNPISVSKWALGGNVPRKTLESYLAEMRRKGWIKTTGEGTTARQYITNVGKAFLDGGQHGEN